MKSELSEKVKKIVAEQKGNCAQAVFAIYGDFVSSRKVDFDTGMKIASAFGGGVANTGNICGALNGALMVLGLKYGGSPMEQRADDAAVKLLDEFKSLNGTIFCRELIGHDLVTDEDVKHAFDTGAFNNCPKFVEDVGKLLEKRL